MHTRKLFGVFRLTLALGGLVSIVAGYLWAIDTDASMVGNYFAYLTVQSNVLFVVVSMLGAVSAFRADADAQWLTTVRTVTLTLTCTSGVVFAVLVLQAAAIGTPMDVPWSDISLHYVLPVLALVEWVAAPGRGRGQWRALPVTLGLVGAWGIATLIRGPIVGWYPYFFLDPAQVSGIAETGMFCLLAIAIFSSLGAAVIGLTVVTVPGLVTVVVTTIGRVDGTARTAFIPTADAGPGRPVALADLRGAASSSASSPVAA